ncbi:MAG TPA: hypothetical protein VIK98_10165 [Limnochordales bacterium]
MAIRWQELVPSWPGVAGWWSAERLRLLDEYMRRAEDCHRRGEWDAAALLWEEALRRLPDMPAPRRLQIEQRLRDTLAQAARAALARRDVRERGAYSQARRYLEHAARLAADGAILFPLGLLLHIEGEPGAALQCYEEAARAGARSLQDSPALAYACRLARLQLRVASRSAAPADEPDGESGLARRPASEAVPLELSRGRDPLEAAAWKRLGALAALAAGETSEALARFPVPAHAVLPAAWALEGALLAALAGDWSACLAYYRRAQAEGVHPAGEPHLYVFAVAWLAASDGGDEPPFPAAALREQAPVHLFVDDAQYRAWRRQFLRWQYRWWLARAEAAAARADAAGVQRNLTAAIRLLPKARLSRALEMWLACAYGGVRPPKEAVGRAMDGLIGGPADAARAALLRLSVLMCERFGSPAEVVGQLNRLLELAPEDQWGLERWKRWMMRLGQEAMAQGRLRQALLQFVSLLLRRPDDADGWRWCGRVHAELGDADRASDCLAQAERLESLARRQSRSRGWFHAGTGQEADGRAVGISDGRAVGISDGRAANVSDGRAAGVSDGRAAGGDTGEPEYGVLVDLIRTLAGEDVAAAPVAFSAKALRKAVWASVRASDPYLEFLLGEWARSPGSSASAG